MDPITQGLLGACASQACLEKKIAKKSWVVGGLAGMAPDLDIFIRSQSDPLLFYIYHRHFSHALAFIPIGGLLVGGVFLALFPSYRKQWPWVLLAAVIGYASHGVLDACTIYGTLLYWPFSHQRVAWDLIAIIDPIFTITLLIGVCWSALNHRNTAAQIALALALIYMGFRYFGHQHALSLQSSLITQRAHTAIKRRALPMVGQPFHWKSLYRTDDKIWVDLLSISPTQKPRIQTGIQVPLMKAENLPERIKRSRLQMRDFRVFRWFSDGFITQTQDHPLIITDLRYIFGFHPPRYLWGIEFPEQINQHIQWKTRVKTD